MPSRHHVHRKQWARLRAIGSYIPSERIDNAELIKRLKLQDTSIPERIGIVSRAVMAGDETVVKLCVKAFDALTRRMEIDLSAIEILCVVTQSPDRSIPHMAAEVHEQLGLSAKCMTFDISQGCSGYVHAITVLDGLMSQYACASALLFTCDPYSRIVDPDDRNTAPIFGDAATVTLMEFNGPGYGIVTADFGTVPGTAGCLRCDEHLHMDGRAILMNAAREVPRSIQTVLERAECRIEDIDVFLLHPGSRYVVDLLKDQMDLDNERAPFEIQHYGNTVSSSLPLMLERRFEPGASRKIILSGFGVGFTWGTALIEYGN